MSEELTAEELAIVNGEDIEDESAPYVPEEAEETPAEEPVAEEVPEEEPTEPEAQQVEPDVEALKRANKGILEELIKTRRSAKEDREWKQAVIGRMDAMQDRLTPQEEPEPVPDKDEDPFGWMVHQQKIAAAEAVQPIKEELDAAKQEQDVNTFQTRFIESTQAAESHFLENADIGKEDYESRLDAVRLDRAKWYVATGLDQIQAEEAVKVDELGFIAQCLQEGRNPAAEAMRMYEVLQPQLLDKPTQEAVKPPGDLSKVDAVRRGQNTNKLGSVEAQGDASVITFEEFASRPEDDPVVQKILADPKKFMKIQVDGQVTL